MTSRYKHYHSVDMLRVDLRDRNREHYEANKAAEQSIPVSSDITTIDITVPDMMGNLVTTTVDLTSYQTELTIPERVTTVDPATLTDEETDRACDAARPFLCPFVGTGDTYDRHMARLSARYAERFRQSALSTRDIVVDRS